MNNLKEQILFGKYRVLNYLGNGSFSSVILVKHISMDQERAIKIIPRNNVSSSSELIEAKILNFLNHPNIPKIYDIEEDEFNYYLVEEYIQGESLNVFLLHHKVISLDLFYKICEQLFDIFSYLHNFSPSPILYRDLKPEHIIVCGKDIKLIDFGISSYVTNSGNNFNHYGNVGFSAPECFTEDDISLSADIYSIGKLIEYLTSYLEKPVSHNIKNIIQKSTINDPLFRYETVELMVSDFKKIQTDNHTHSRKSIAIVGSSLGCGSTHIAITMVSTLNSLGYSAVYFETNESNDLQNAAKYHNSLVEKNGYFTYKSFCGLPAYGKGIQFSIPDNIISVYDYGTDYDPDDLKRADIVILVCDNAIWRLKNAIRSNEYIDSYGITTNIICNLCDKQQSLTIAKQLSKSVHFFPYNSDPFELNINMEIIISQILDKKGWSRFFSKRKLKMNIFHK